MNRSLRRYWLAGRLALLVVAAGGSLVTTATWAQQAARPQVNLVCAYALGVHDKLGPARPDTGASDAAANDVPALRARMAECRSRSTLHGSGDVVVVATTESWKAAKADPTQKDLAPRLFIDGIPVADDALISTEGLADGTTRLRFHVSANAKNRALWLAIYRQQFIRASPARIALGWEGSEVPTTVSLQGQASGGIAPNIEISTGWRTLSALAWLAVIAAVLAYCLVATDAFRDRALPGWWAAATRLRKQWKTGAGARQRASPTATDLPILLQQHGYWGLYIPGQEAEYLKVAREALAGKIDPQGAESDRATFGALLLPPEDVKFGRGTFSLARLQSGLWLFFVVAAGVFIWLFTGELPSIEPTLLGLLAVSAATTVASVAVDKSSEGRPFQRSRGVLRDITTGWDGAQQLHRVQALVVNLVLFGIALDAVVQDLAMTKLDATWLALLGVSGATQTLMKRTLEKDTSTQDSSTDGPSAAPLATPPMPPMPSPPQALAAAVGAAPMPPMPMPPPPPN
jgi:hypothetical protein